MPLLVGKPFATSVPERTLIVPVLVIGTSSVCVAAEPAFLLNVPALENALPARVAAAVVIGAAFVEVSVMTPVPRLTSVAAPRPRARSAQPRPG